MNQDIIDACVNLVDRAGASGFEIGHMHARWVPGCDAPPIVVKGERGDHAAMEKALREQAGAGNRAQRRAAMRGGRRA